MHGRPVTRVVWHPGPTKEAESRRLIKAGYDGLFFPGECACLADDLYPCGDRHDDCEPGYKGDCSNACHHEGAGDGEWHITRTKQSKSPAVGRESGVDSGPTVPAPETKSAI